MNRRWVAVGAVIAIAAYGCGGSSSPPEPPDRPDPPAGTATPAAVDPSPEFAPYEPPPGEEYPNGKRIAGRIAQRLLTYDTGASPEQVARALSRDGRPRVRAASLAAAVNQDMQSVGRVMYVQLSGVTPTTLGTMVLARQHLQDSTGRRRTVTRVLDVRLRREGGPWSLDTVASVGGSPVPRPRGLSAPATRVLDHRRIFLPDTARWDIHRRAVDDALLQALADAAERRPISVTVLRTGHPANVWGTERRSAHRDGLAADLYAVGGLRVIRQRTAGSDARQLAAALLAGGATQVGSPWVLSPGAPRSFTDAVHQDHLHLQQSAR